MEHFHGKIGGWFNFEDVYRNAVGRFPSGSHFVEVGTWLGKSASYMAVEIVNSKKEIKFDCVDLWRYWDGQSDINENTYQYPFGNLYLDFLKNIKPVRHVINPIQLFSAEAAKLYENESLDFIFIDAAHDYKNVKKDINSWYPKLKKSGIIAGHDFPQKGVRKAVKEIFGEAAKKNGKCWVV